MFQVVCSERGDPISDLLGAVGRCRNYIAKIKRGDEVRRFIFMVIKYKWLKIASPVFGRLHDKSYSYYWRIATSPANLGCEVGKKVTEAFKKGLEQR